MLEGKPAQQGRCTIVMASTIPLLPGILCLNADKNMITQKMPNRIDANQLRLLPDIDLAVLSSVWAGRGGFSDLPKRFRPIEASFQIRATSKSLRKVRSDQAALSAAALQILRHCYLLESE